MMKIGRFIFLFCLCSNAIVFAQKKPELVPGGDISGGGGDLAGRWTSRLWKVVERMEKTGLRAEQIWQLRENLQKPGGLDVILREVLINPETQKPILNDQFEAYGSPGLIQLKGTEISSPWLSHLQDPSKDYLWAHEAMRSGKVSALNDKGYGISIQEFKLGLPEASYWKEYGLVFDLPLISPRTNPVAGFVQACAVGLDSSHRPCDSKTQEVFANLFCEYKGHQRSVFFSASNPRNLENLVGSKTAVPIYFVSKYKRLQENPFFVVSLTSNSREDDGLVFSQIICSAEKSSVSLVEKPESELLKRSQTPFGSFQSGVHPDLEKMAELLTKGSFHPLFAKEVKEAKAALDRTSLYGVYTPLQGELQWVNRTGIDIIYPKLELLREIHSKLMEEISKSVKLICDSHEETNLSWIYQLYHLYLAVRGQDAQLRSAGWGTEGETFRDYYMVGSTIHLKAGGSPRFVIRSGKSLKMATTKPTNEKQTIQITFTPSRRFEEAIQKSIGYRQRELEGVASIMQDLIKIRTGSFISGSSVVRRSRGEKPFIMLDLRRQEYISSGASEAPLHIAGTTEKLDKIESPFMTINDIYDSMAKEFSEHRILVETPAHMKPHYHPDQHPYGDLVYQAKYTSNDGFYIEFDVFTAPASNGLKGGSVVFRMPASTRDLTFTDRYPISRVETGSDESGQGLLIRFVISPAVPPRGYDAVNNIFYPQGKKEVAGFIKINTSELKASSTDPNGNLGYFPGGSSEGPFVYLDYKLSKP